MAARCWLCTGGTLSLTIRAAGDSAHAVLAAQPGLARLAEHTEADFRAEVYQRTDGAAVSVAQASGLA